MKSISIFSEINNQFAAQNYGYGIRKTIYVLDLILDVLLSDILSPTRGKLLYHILRYLD
ncbi:MAG: hypothetical protein ACQ9ET_04305 [Nitrosomonadaceae bacterium]